jgi:uncharacterized protein
VLYLIITDKCNLECRYCFIEAGFSEDYECRDMDWDTAKKSIDLFNKQRNRRLQGRVWLYGGEPLLNSDLFFKCLDYIEEVSPDLEVMTVSNGTVITKDIAERMTKYKNLNISISLDGPKAIHDQLRVDKAGRGSYDRVIKGINYLKESGLDFGISCTLAEHNVDVVSSVAEWINRDLGVNLIGVNFLVDTPKAFVEEEYIKKANSGLIDFFQKTRGEGVYESRIMRKINAFVKGEPRWHDCAACGNQMVISPLGEIGICHEGLGERRTFVGSINEDFDFYNNIQIKEWANRSPATTQECKKCSALGICGGGCPYGAMLRYGNINEVDRRFCVHSKDTLEWLIWDLYGKIKTRMEAGSQ